MIISIINHTNGKVSDEEWQAWLAVRKAWREGGIAKCRRTIGLTVASAAGARHARPRTG